MTQRTKQIIIVIVIIIIAFIGFKMFFAPKVSPDTTLVADQATSAQFVDGQTILVLLNNLNQVTLDDSIFSNNIFISLVDFERPIQDQVIGRQNPFLPIGIDGSGITLPLSTSSASTTRAR
jgi:hypothetical protein